MPTYQQQSVNPSSALVINGKEPKIPIKVVNRQGSLNRKSDAQAKPQKHHSGTNSSGAHPHCKKYSTPVQYSVPLPKVRVAVAPKQVNNQPKQGMPSSDHFIFRTYRDLITSYGYCNFLEIWLAVQKTLPDSSATKLRHLLIVYVMLKQTNH